VLPARAEGAGVGAEQVLGQRQRGEGAGGMAVPVPAGSPGTETLLAPSRLSPRESEEERKSLWAS